MAGSIRRADPADVPRMVDLSEQKRIEYQGYQPRFWREIGVALLAEVGREAKARGAVQTVVVCGHLDEPKRAMLAAAGFTIASEWYVRET